MFYRTYSNLPKHYGVQITALFWLIDEWRWPTPGDTFWITADTSSWPSSGWNYSVFSSNLCGNPSIPDIGALHFAVARSHTANTITVKINSGLYSSSNVKSFGFRELNITFTNDSTPTSYCQIASIPIPVNYNVDPCVCPYQNQYYDPPNSGKCLPCDPSCRTCKGGGDTNCTGCYTGKYLISGKCTCHTSCLTCNGASENNCLTCYPGDTYMVKNNTCATECSFPLIVTSNGVQKFCQSPCPLSQFVLMNGSCLSSCVSPLKTTLFANVINFCTNPCKDDEYLFWNQTCLPNCSFPLVNRTDIGKQCIFPCSGSTYVLKFDGTCISYSSCSSPFIIRSIAGKYYCNKPCLESYYYHYNGTCIPTCPFPLQITDTSGYLRCIFPCGTVLWFNGTCSTTGGCVYPFKLIYDGASGKYFCNNPCQPSQYLFANQSCSNRCDFPLFSANESNTLRCYSPCGDTQYLFMNGSCTVSCGAPFTVKNYGTGNKYCLNTCKISQYLYWNSSCRDTCPFPFKIVNASVAVICNNPCGSATNQRLWFNGSCTTSCPSPFKERYEASRYYCDYPCKTNQYLYWNSSCYSTCSFPLQIVNETNTTNVLLCKYPCTTSPTRYLFMNGTCATSCPSPFSAITEGGRKYCKNRCKSSSYLYWNGTCLPHCEMPLQIINHTMSLSLLCSFPCNTYSEYLMWDGTCSSNCPSPLCILSFSLHS